MRLLPFAFLALLAACSPAADKGAPNEKEAAAGERQVASILDTPDVQGPAKLCPAARSAGDPRRARPQGRFRRQADRRHRHPRRPVEAGTRRRSSSTARGWRSRPSPTGTASRSASPSARPIPISDAPLTVELGGASRIRITLCQRPRRGGAAMADARADRGQEASLPVQPGPGDPQPHLDPDPGQPRHPPDLGSPDRRPRALAGGDERRTADPRRRGRRRRRPRLPLPDGQAGRALSDRDRRRRHRLPERSGRAPASMPSRRRSRRRPPSWSTPRRWSPRPRSSTAPIAGAATT